MVKILEEQNAVWKGLLHWFDQNDDGVITQEEFPLSFVSAALLHPAEIEWPAAQVRANGEG